ncbi:MAG: hypothetical protein ACE5HC_12455 [Candidatus Binatia bacterium]
MRLSVRSLTITAALFWAFSFLFVSVANYLWPPYGKPFLELVDSLYPGYKALGTPNSIIIGTFYALADGAVGGLVFAWLYNTFRD